MKPTVEQNNLSKRADVAERNAGAFPSIDCNYQTVALPSYRGQLPAAKIFIVPQYQRRVFSE